MDERSLHERRHHSSRWPTSAAGGIGQLWGHEQRCAATVSSCRALLRPTRGRAASQRACAGARWSVAAGWRTAAGVRMLAQLGVNEEDLLPLLGAYASAGADVWMSPAAPSGCCIASR